MNERLAFGDPLGDALKHLAYRIGSDRDAGGIGNGERAELRRWHGGTLPPAFWRFAVVGEVAAAIDERVGNEKDRLAVERAFATIMKSMAIMGPLAASSGERMPLGAALGATRYSEDRFVRLLRARDDVLAAEAADGAALVRRQREAHRVAQLCKARLRRTRGSRLRPRTRGARTGAPLFLRSRQGRTNRIRRGKRSMTSFIQIHTLTPYAATLLNRDDVGRAKRLPFGGASRIRVSSQCLKRHWREAASEWGLKGLQQPMSVRSRRTFVQEIAQPLVDEGYDRTAVIVVLDALKAQFLGESKKAKAARADKKTKAAGSTDDLDILRTEQIIVLGRPEIAYLKSLAAEILKEAPDAPAAEKAVEDRLKDKDLKRNVEGLRLAAGLDAALFGRMVTSDILARGDAAIHVAHSFTVHAEEAEPDYFTAVDDLTSEAGELGAGLIQTSELTSGLFYGYAVVDVGLLVKNLSNDADLAAEAVRRLVGLIATTSPGAKRGSTAPYGYADLVLVEAGERQPRSLANAFQKAVPLAGDVRQAAADALTGHLKRFDGVYGRGETRKAASLLDLDGLDAEALNLAGLADWAASLALEERV